VIRALPVRLPAEEYGGRRVDAGWAAVRVTPATSRALTTKVVRRRAAADEGVRCGRSEPGHWERRLLASVRQGEAEAGWLESRVTRPALFEGARRATSRSRVKHNDRWRSLGAGVTELLARAPAGTRLKPGRNRGRPGLHKGTIKVIVALRPPCSPKGIGGPRFEVSLSREPAEEVKVRRCRIWSRR